MRNATTCPFQQRRQLVLEARARHHRSALNFPAQLLWRELSAGKLGVYFRRQVVLARRFIVDCFAPSIGLVVEVDGRCHERSRGRDARRDETLRGLGYHVLRVAAQDVVHDLPGVVGRVRGVVAEVRRR
jgi:very-short-patch-repair endonuclease